MAGRLVIAGAPSRPRNTFLLDDGRGSCSNQKVFADGPGQ
ncbi:hypothetical protein I546_6949 [Mycobacterium kansasii 732]|nr:hypothetical protein I546_6949 [Mycobacterium kansasii 732]